MKDSTYEDYKWFIMGASLVASKVFWTKEGNSNKKLITSVSQDGTVASIKSKEDK